MARFAFFTFALKLNIMKKQIAVVGHAPFGSALVAANQLAIQRAQMKAIDAAADQIAALTVKDNRRRIANAKANAIILTAKDFVKYLNSVPLKKNRGAYRKRRELGYYSKNAQKHEARKHKFNR